ncbi:Aluminum-activated malate transporter 10 [Dichanthelium oligosanthes]|uniref:Aluminum-activated malate transporter 10 n=1 Tax=Dichanthelium oligosanthes TaxID=888268 RepID=A0A1E5VJT2_9POAL|nr:Aluminum-activated malate transporter 10 [Dichanthelium oligosanthes]
MDAAAREARGGLEWRVTVPEGASVTVEHEAGAAARAWAWLLARVAMVWSTVAGSARKVWRIGADDPRKAVHGLKVGLSLALVSVFYYTRPLYDGVGGAAMWAIMTVVVVFEYTVGGSVYKSFNRAVATASAGVLALGVHWVAGKTGELEPYILTGSLFLLAAAATFSRFIPTVKARFDYGVTIFILTYSLVAVSGYRVDQLAALAQQRVSTIAIGIFMCLAVSVFICPVWAGQELHLLTTRNMDKLADALEACVDDYFAEDPAARPAQAKSDGYKCVLNSKASEDAQANLARWEPAHGRFAFRHPYTQYGKVGAAMRACAYCVEALSSCAGAEVQAPEHVKRLLHDACARVGARCARVLREASRSVATMKSYSALDFAVADMNTAVHELQGDMRSLPSMLAVKLADTSLMDTMPVFTVASLLVEISARVEAVVDSVDALATLANFKQVDDDDDDDEKKGEAEMTTKVHPLNEPDTDEESLPENQTSKA